MSIALPVRGDISFGGLVLNSVPFTVDTLALGGPPLEVSTFPRLTRPGSLRSQSRIAARTIQIQGRILGRNRSRLTRENEVDWLKRIIYSGPQNLKIGYTDQRYYQNAEAVDDGLTVEWPEAQAHEVIWTANLLCRDPLLLAATASQLTDNAALSTVSGNHRRKIMTPTVGGDAPTWPRIQITMPGAGPYGTSAIWVVNASDPSTATLTVTRTFAAGEILIIDCASQLVTVNGSNVTFAGKFPRLERVWGKTNSIEIHSTSTSLPTLNVVIDWTPRWY